MVRAKGLVVIAFIAVSLFGCSKKNDESKPAIHDITGTAQKGPFIQGSSITLYDLKDDLSPTGMSFNTQIINNEGSFAVEKVPLSSDYISLRADGFYFNEVTGTPSVSQITLYALADISDSSNINVNILTHLEKPRVEYLIKNGRTFTEAKAQAQKEILAIFSIEKEDIKTSEYLNITGSGNDNAILLAVSAIIQGFRSESELTELLSNISNDIREDGTLDNAGLGSKLVSHALYLDTASVRDNLVGRYQALGISVNIAGFGRYISEFLGQTDFDDTESLFKYPQTGSYGNNVLYLSGTEYASGIDIKYSLAAVIPPNIGLKIRMTSLSADTVLIPASDSTSATTEIRRAMWYYHWGTEINWSISDFNQEAGTQTFMSIETGKTSDVKMFFEKGSFLLEYFETNADTPSRTRTIKMH
jgi:hypothetical protein